MVHRSTILKAPEQSRSFTIHQADSFDFSCPPCSGDNGVKVRQSSQLTAYMLVNNASDLQSINTDVTRPDAYALGRDINASSIANFTPLGTLNTIFDG